MRLLITLGIVLIVYSSFGQKRDTFLLEKGYYERSRWTISDTAMVSEILEKAHKIAYAEEQRSEVLSRAALAISQKLETSEGEIRSYLCLSTSKIQQNQTDSALHYVLKAKSIAKKSKMDHLLVQSLDQEAVVYAYQEKYDKSTQTCFEAIKLGAKIGPKHTARSKSTLGYVFMKLGNLKRSSEYSQQGFDLALGYKDTALMLSNLNILSLNLKNTDNLEAALDKFEYGLSLAIESGNLQRQSQIYYNMSNIMFDLGRDAKGLKYFNESIEISKVNGSYLSTAISFHSLANKHWELGNAKQAIRTADSTLHYALLSENFEIIMEAYALNADVEYRFGSAADAYSYMTYAYAYKDSMNLAQLRDASVSAESQFEEEKRRMQDSLKTVQQQLQLDNQKRITNQRLQSRDRLIWIFVVALILFLVVGYFLLKNNRLIKSQNALVNLQKEEIQLQHSEIRDSIDYAQRIQAAMINKRSEWDKLGQHYIFFRPKDVVSGDFYWAHNKNDLSIWVVADCTGHGVPGAFMSMLGFGFLNEIVIERNCSDAAEILNLLRTKIIAALGEQGENQARDGMDVSVCIWDKSTSQLQYAGANNPLWIIRHKSSEVPDSVRRVTSVEASALHLMEIEPDKMPVGFVDSATQPFKNKEISLFSGDVIVQFTDGYADQFGGPNGKKFKYAPMKRALIDWQSIQFDQQPIKMAQTFDTWRGDLEQVDDVCVVAVKVD